MDFAVQHRLPRGHAYRELVEVGGLMFDMHRRAVAPLIDLDQGAAGYPFDTASMIARSSDV
jgi:hypothetical protein